MRCLLISFNKRIMQRGQATKTFKHKKENFSSSSILKLVFYVKRSCNFRNFLLFDIYCKLSVFENKTNRS